MAASLLVLVVEIIPLPRRAARLVATSTTLEEAVASHMFCPPLSLRTSREARSATHALGAALAKKRVGAGGMYGTYANIVISRFHASLYAYHPAFVKLDPELLPNRLACRTATAVSVAVVDARHPH